MNNISKLLLGAAAIIGLSACSDEPKGNGNSTTIPDGQKAYLTVNIQSADNGSRATTIGGYEYGETQEHDVQTASFFFFDANGLYVGSTHPAKGDWTEGDKPNVEWIGKNVIVLEDLAGNTYPNYMLTVLNCPDSFNPVTGDSYTNITRDLTQFGELGNFVMTTSSYYGTDSHHDNKFPMLTKLLPSDFSLEPVVAQPANQVDVYVERLAAKVQVNVKMSDTQEKGNADNLYKIDATVMGEDNNGQQANIDLYVRLEGWALNATAKNSYISKQLLPAWETTAPFTGWDNATDFRSFWAEAWPYNQANFAESNNAAYFDYIDYNTATKFVYGGGKDGFAYCNENTNVPGNLLKEFEQTPGNKVKAVVPSYVTNVTLAATVCDVNGDALDLVDYDGTLFTKANYLKYALSMLQNAGKEVFTYEKTGTTEVQAKDEEGNLLYNEDGTPKMVEVDVMSYIGLPETSYEWEAANNGTGTIYVKANVADDTEVYVKDEKGEYTKTTVAAANEALLAYQVQNFAKAVAYNGGRMVYNIPIEHWAGNNEAMKVEDEGYYGVVRNHWYRLTVSKVAKIGHGIFNPGSDDKPGEPIIPDAPEDPRYYVAARINILSWKIIEQGNIEL